ncbi:MAG: hypothetical protein ACREE3_05415, partial [Stellaceae bacterium]
MQRLTRIILAVAVTVALAVAFCGLAPVVSAARPRQQAYVPGAGTATLKHRHPHYRHSERLARRVHRRRSTQRHRRRGERRHHPMRHARRRMPARAGPA